MKIIAKWYLAHVRDSIKCFSLFFLLWWMNSSCFIFLLCIPLLFTHQELWLWSKGHKFCWLAHVDCYSDWRIKIHDPICLTVIRTIFKQRAKDLGCVRICKLVHPRFLQYFCGIETLRKNICFGCNQSNRSNVEAFLWTLKLKLLLYVPCYIYIVEMQVTDGL